MNTENKSFIAKGFFIVLAIILLAAVALWKIAEATKSDIDGLTADELKKMTMNDAIIINIFNVFAIGVLVCLGYESYDTHKKTKDEYNPSVGNYFKPSPTATTSTYKRASDYTNDR